MNRRIVDLLTYAAGTLFLLGIGALIWGLGVLLGD